MYVGDALNVNANRMKASLRNSEQCSNHEPLLEQLKNYQSVKRLTQKQSRGPMTWKDMLENALGDIASWRTKKWSSSTKFQVFAWMVINSNRNNLNQSENCHKFARKLSWNVRIWHEFEDQTFCGLSINLQEQSQNGLRHATDDWVVWFPTSSHEWSPTLLSCG